MSRGNLKPVKRRPSKHRQKRFLTAYRECGVIGEAARIASVDRSQHWQWLKDPEYAKEFEQAKEYALDVLRSVAWKRALAKSDTLLIFLLKSARPEEFSEAHRLYIDGKLAHKGQLVLKPVPPDEPRIPVEDMPLELQRKLLDWMRQRKTEQEARQLPGPEMKEVVEHAPSDTPATVSTHIRTLN
jgi:hypothetical protein